jgi:hypothetical protein
VKLNRSSRTFGKRGVAHLLRLAIAMALGIPLLVGLATATQAAPTSHRGVHVYLLRGVMNVFSLGMDQIAAELQQQGIDATVNNHLAWPVLAEEAAADYKSGRVRTIILVGHSAGAAAVTQMVNRLGELGVPVKLAIGLDPVSQTTASGHVGSYVNYYVGNGAGEPVRRGPQFTGVLRNVDVEKMPDVGHFTIDKNAALQARIISSIRAAL